MKLRQSLILGAAIAAGVFGLGSVGCGDDSSTGTGGSSSGTAGEGGSTGTDGTGGSVPLVKPTPRPDGAGPGDGADNTYLGISRLYLGDTDRGGATSPTAWEKFGYDLDNLATGANAGAEFDSADLGDHCTPVGGEATVGNLQDGEGGVDNSFGKNILSFLSSVLEDPSETASEAIEEGSFTIALRMDKLGDGKNYDPISTNLYAGVGGEDDEWEYVNALLNGGDPDSPKIKFPKAYVNNNTWVSGEPQTITLSLAIAGVDLDLVIQSAIVAVDLNDGHTGGTNGVIAGVLDTESFVAELGEVASRVAGGTDGLCPGEQLFESIVQNIRSASDILKDGTNKAGVTCDGISIAIGFDMDTVVFGDVAPDPEPEPSSCDE